MTKYTDIGVEKHGHVGLIEIRKPPLNFFDISLINQIADALEEFDKDIEIRASVLAAQGKAFCAGANFSDPKRQEQEAQRAKAIRPPTCRSTISICRPCASSATRSRSSPPCMAPPSAAGSALRYRADFRVTCPEARFAANFTKLGFHPGFGLTATLPELVGKNNAELIFYTSRRVTGEEATRMGLANICVPQDQVRAEAMKLAARDRRMLAARPALDPRHHARRPRRPRAGRHQPRTRRTDPPARHRRFQGRRQGHRGAPRREFQGAVEFFFPSPLVGEGGAEGADEGSLSS